MRGNAASARSASFSEEELLQRRNFASLVNET
jgi:hypothetical protein